MKAAALLALLLTVPAAAQVSGQTCTPGKVCRPAALQMACVATGSLPACGASLTGQTRCDSTLNCLVYCNGSAWACVASSSGVLTATAPLVVTGTDIALPAAAAGVSGYLRDCAGIGCYDAGLHLVTPAAEVVIASTTSQKGIRWENGASATSDWEFRKVTAANDSNFGLYVGSTLYTEWSWSLGTLIHTYRLASNVASGSVAYSLLTGARYGLITGSGDYFSCDGTTCTWVGTSITAPALVTTEDVSVGNNATLGRHALAVAAGGIYTDGGLVAYGGSGNDVTIETSGIRLENGTTDWQFQKVANGANSNLGIYGGSTNFVLWDRLSGTMTTAFDLAVGDNGTLGRAGLAVPASGIYTDGGVSAPLFTGNATATTNTLTSATTAATASSTVAAWTFTQSETLGANDLAYDFQNAAATKLLKIDTDGLATFAGQLRADNLGIPTGANGAARMLTTSGGLTQWITALDAVSAQVDPSNGAMVATTLGPVSGVLSVETMHLANSTNIGSITLSAGTGTAVVNTGAKCVCQDTSATPLVVRCSVSGTTLTATEASGTNVITYICL